MRALFLSRFFFCD